MSVGDQAYHNARKRLARLEKDAAELREFLAMCERYARLSPSEESAVDTAGKPAPEGRNQEPDENDSGRPTATPALIREWARAEMVSDGKPMNRGDLVALVEGRGHFIKTKDKANYIGTVMWRARDEFVNFPNEGYWPADLPYAPQNYQGAKGARHLGSGEGGLDDESTSRSSDVSDDKVSFFDKE